MSGSVKSGVKWGRIEVKPLEVEPGPSAPPEPSAPPAPEEPPEPSADPEPEEPPEPNPEGPEPEGPEPEGPDPEGPEPDPEPEEPEPEGPEPEEPEPEEPSADPEPEQPAPPELDPRRDLPPTRGAEAIVRRWSLWSAGVSVIPLPLVDFAACAGFSLKMLHELARYYGVEFRAEAGKASIAALLGGTSTPLVAAATGSLLKGVPVLGLLAVTAAPLLAGSTTYGIGKVFTAHFGAGGTLFDFDPERFRDFFQEQIAAGKGHLQRTQGR